MAMPGLAEKLLKAGVVGAGGAGFPSHVKAAARNIEYVIANGAECEPLIHKDYEIMLRHPDRVLDGLLLLAEATGAPNAILGVKRKNSQAVDALTRMLTLHRGGAHTEHARLHLLGDFYPSGDEYILVYESTGRLVPPRGIPPDVGVLVCNVETLYNVSYAAEGAPVTEKFITVGGAVRKPVTLRVPVGTSVREAIRAAGGFPQGREGEYSVFANGLMMGTLLVDLEEPVTKTTSGLVVLPRDHMLVLRRNQPPRAMHKIGKSACDQCSYCTELCPRYILGYDVQPHKVMRSLSFTSTGSEIWNQSAVLCCACGLCTLYACPENLFPKEACDAAKEDLRKNQIPWAGRKDVRTHPMYEGRRTPLRQLVKKLGVESYDVPSVFSEKTHQPERVAIKLRQHTGAAALPTVKPGERVRKGQCVGEIPEGSLGARVHSSIDGVVESTGETILITKA